MGSGSYSYSDATVRSATYSSQSTAEIFTQRSIKNEMDPKNTVRECCDSVEHPETVPIIIALDVTGSMGRVPDAFIREGMTSMMSNLYDAGLTSSQVLFMGIGDHECDAAPLQVGQFEADDQLLDKWLKEIYLEGGGGANEGESYLLAWYYAAFHTRIDSFEKRGKKGFLFTIGDEPTLKTLPGFRASEITGGSAQDMTHESILEAASEKYNVFHIHLTETRSGSREHVQAKWKQDMADNAIILKSYHDIGRTISEVVSNMSKSSELVEAEVML